ncbi:RNA-directed DNA methylation 4 isoform X2 [Cucumis melo]|uniref:RNA-directed DNA methylation 4 isoform X2 n=1 Tax=Cucumis melo TaxID=3656 RepID=A0ABM3KJF8_CUCME|nr:RNA-directed DNA methylation 4 isoform X2 [Cucumis melo]
MSRAAPSLRPSGRRSSTQPLRRLQSPVFGLEINGRPSKRPLLDFENLSISETLHKEELKTKKIFVQHVETLRSSDATVAIVQSFVTNISGGSEYVIKLPAVTKGVYSKCGCRN